MHHRKKKEPTFSSGKKDKVVTNSAGLAVLLCYVVMCGEVILKIRYYAVNSRGIWF